MCDQITSALRTDRLDRMALLSITETLRRMPPLLELITRAYAQEAQGRSDEVRAATARIKVLAEILLELMPVREESEAVTDEQLADRLEHTVHACRDAIETLRSAPV